MSQNAGAGRPLKAALVYVLIIGLSLLFVAWTGSNVFSGLSDLSGNLGGHMGQFAFAAAFPALALDLWALTAGLLFISIWFNPLRWVNVARLSVGVAALAVMLGRLDLGWLPSLLAAAGSFSPLGLVIIAALTPFALLLGGLGAIIVAVLTVITIYSLIVAIPLALYSQLTKFERERTMFRFKTNGLIGYVNRFLLWVTNTTLPHVPDDSKGARFATDDEINRLRVFDGSQNMAFGHKDGAPLFITNEKHVLIMASTRSGKGVSLIIPHLLRYQGSAFVLDPKGENARATGRQRALFNNQVHYLDPFGISGKPKARFNPLARFTTDNMEAESKALAAALFVLGERERDHWNAAAQQLLASIILFVFLSPAIPPREKDLATVRKTLLGNLKGALDAMTEMDQADGLLRDLAVSFLQTPEKEFGSIVSSAQRQTEILDNPYIVACLKAHGPGAEVDFKQWHRGTMTVYLCLSAPKFPTFNRWLRLVLTAAIDEMTDTLNPPPVPVCFMLDELATLGHLASVENAIGLAAGYGIQLVTVFQDVAQMRDLYKGRWASFVGNAGVRALFNLDDYDTAEYWSKFLGTWRTETRGRSEDKYGFSDKTNIGETTRPLVSPEDLMLHLAEGGMLALVQGQRPIRSRRVPYWEDQTLAGAWDDPRAQGGPVRSAPLPASQSAAPSPWHTAPLPQPAAPSAPWHKEPEPAAPVAPAVQTKAAAPVSAQQSPIYTARSAPLPVPTVEDDEEYDSEVDYSDEENEMCVTKHINPQTGKVEYRQETDTPVPGKMRLYLIGNLSTGDFKIVEKCKVPL